MQLSPTMQRLILHWGEMGSRWGLNRSVAQIYAVLFFSPGTLTADDIASALSLARSNVSTSIRELQSWGVVRVVPKLGDRRDHYEALEDVWVTLQRVAAERRRKELDPTIEILRETLGQDGEETQADLYLRERAADLLDFLGVVAVWHDEIRRLPAGALRKLAALAEKIGRLVNGGAKKPTGAKP